MKKWQARVLTSLLIITLAHVLYGASFVKSYYGFSLHQLITHALGYIYGLANALELFTKRCWNKQRHDDSKVCGKKIKIGAEIGIGW